MYSGGDAPMNRAGKAGRATGEINDRMLVVKDFIDEFYNKTVFQNGKAANSDLTPAQIKAFFAFKEDDREYPIGELGRNARVKSSTITDMIDRLEKEGIAERLKDRGDRRVVKVKLTARGREIKRQFVLRMRSGMEQAFSKLSDAEKKALLDHLKGAYEILKKI
jgi:DNA-binding MarR family transcriptional regulator